MRKLLALVALMAVLLSPARAAVRPTGELHAALVAWAEGDEAGALVALRTLDERGSGQRVHDAQRRLKLSLARGLGRQQPAAVLAFARLEERAYLAYVAEGRPVLAVGARTLFPELVAVALGSRPRPAQRELAAMLLANFAGHLDLGGQHGGAGTLYQRALALDPRQRAALLGLAAAHEKRGSYAEALPLLAELLRLDPTHREAGLRWALSLQRMGRGAESEASLHALARSGGDWVQSLAAQERARGLLARGETGAAVEVLAAALDALPCDPALPVLAALASERAGGGQPLDLATLAGCGEAAGSARARYARPSSSELQPLARRIAAADGEWRAALRRALARTR